MLKFWGYFSDLVLGVAFIALMLCDLHIIISNVMNSFVQDFILKNLKTLVKKDGSLY